MLASQPAESCTHGAKVAMDDWDMGTVKISPDQNWSASVVDTVV